MATRSHLQIVRTTPVIPGNIHLMSHDHYTVSMFSRDIVSYLNATELVQSEVYGYLVKILYTVVHL